jgi:hypothetical protein
MKRERVGHRSMIPIAVFLCLLFIPSVASATNRPAVLDFSFDEGSQRISFWATLGGKEEMSFTIGSSSLETTFSAPKSGSISGAIAGGNSWGITPGGAPTGQEHIFTITVTNANGADHATLCLRVSAGDLLLGPGYDPCPKDNPALPGWAGEALAGLLLVAGVFVFGDRRTKPAT